MPSSNLSTNSTYLNKINNVSIKTSFWLVTVTCLLLWNTPIAATLLLPVSYIVTMIHELSHAIACIATGGQVSGLKIVSDGLGHGGLTFCSGGNPWIYTPAGYIGTTLVGCILLFFSQFKLIARILLFLIGVSVILAALFLSSQSIFAPGMLIQAIQSIIVELIMGGAFIFSSIKLNDKMANLLLMFLCIQIILNSFTDLTVLFQISTFTNTNTFSDATNMAKISGISPAFWSIIWALISIITLWLTLKISYLKSPKPKITTTKH